MKNRKLVFLIISGLIFANIFAFAAVYDLSKNQLLMVDFLDIGQGDSIFIRTPQREKILIDGGPTSLILEKLNKEMPFYDRNIDLIILTHPEHDHLFGLLEVLKNYGVKNILWTGVKKETPEWKEWNKLIKEEGANIEIAKEGERVVMPESFIDVLYPINSLEGKTFKSLNNTSIVCKLVYGKTSFLFTGDIEKPVENKLIKNSNNLDSDVLKIAHHGSKTSSQPEFLEKVSPTIAVISVGKNNKYGHPSDITLANLKKFDIKVLRTDINGDIKIFSTGNSFIVKSNVTK